MSRARRRHARDRAQAKFSTTPNLCAAEVFIPSRARLDTPIRADAPSSAKFNDDFDALKDVHIWAFVRIRGNCRPHSAITHIGQPGVNYDANIDDAGGELNDRFVSPAREFSTYGNLTLLPQSEPLLALADGDHCREMAGKLRELARYTRSPGIRREMVDLAKRYDRRGDHFDRRSGQKI